MKNLIFMLLPNIVTSYPTTPSADDVTNKHLFGKMILTYFRLSYKVSFVDFQKKKVLESFLYLKIPQLSPMSHNQSIKLPTREEVTAPKQCRYQWKTLKIFVALIRHKKCVFVWLFFPQKYFVYVATSNTKKKFRIRELTSQPLFCHSRRVWMYSISGILLLKHDKTFSITFRLTQKHPLMRRTTTSTTFIHFGALMMLQT